jgi:hypothetical protein
MKHGDEKVVTGGAVVALSPPVKLGTAYFAGSAVSFFLCFLPDFLCTLCFLPAQRGTAGVCFTSLFIGACLCLRFAFLVHSQPPGVSTHRAPFGQQ